MEDTTFSNGRGVVWLEAGYYVVGPEGPPTRVQDSKSDQKGINNISPTHGQLEDQYKKQGGDQHDAQHANLNNMLQIVTRQTRDYYEREFRNVLGGMTTQSSDNQQLESKAMREDSANILCPKSQSTLSETPLSTQSHASSNTSAAHSRPRPEKYEARGLLPDASMAQLASAPYDPLWIFNNGVDQSVLESFGSRFKLDQLFGRGLFKVGDVFRMTSHLGAIQTEVEATVIAISTALINAYPDFQIVSMITGATAHLHKCKGLLELWRTMSNQSVTGITSYSGFHVFRNGQDLGNLKTLRQALEIWIEEKDLWSNKLFKAGRRRRAPNKSKGNPAGVGAMRSIKASPGVGPSSI